MSARPMRLCHLEKGKLIDQQQNFVDTFNWMVDYINNLRGDGSYIDLTNPTTDNPVIRFKKINSSDSDVNGIIVNGIDYDGGMTTGNAISSITFQTGADSKESFIVTDDGNGNLTVKLDTYWV